MKRNFTLTLLLVFGSALLFAKADNKADVSKLQKEYPLDGVKAISAYIDVNIADVIIEKAKEKQAFAGDFSYRKQPPEVEYVVDGEEGRLNIRFGEKSNQEKHENGDHNIDFDDLKNWECRLAFSDRVPLSLDFEMEVARGNWDFGGFRLSELEIAASVSELTVDFSKPNPLEMDELEVESGVGNIILKGLGNANFRALEFQGGLGDYELHFDGKIEHDAEADLEIGMGKLEVYLPRNIGIRIRMDDSMMTSVSISDMEKRGKYYTNEHWGSNLPQYDITIDAGISRVVVDWLD